MQHSDIPSVQSLSPFSKTLHTSTEHIMKIISKASVIPDTIKSMDSINDNSSDDSLSPVQTPSLCSTCPSSSASESGDQPDDATSDASTSSAESKDKKSRQDKNGPKPIYKRQPKPPYSYVGMIIMAIQMSSDKELTLSEIHQSVANMFPFFRGSYRGWRDSIRHSLSASPCFYKKPSGRCSKWAVNLTMAPYNALLRQETEVARSTYWEPTICQYLGVPEVIIPTKSCNFNCIDYSTITANSDQQPTTTKRHSDFSIDRILNPAAETADESRPLHAFETSPSFNKMTLKIKARKASTKRQANSKLVKLITDSATKWGVSEETAVEQLRNLCKFMDSTSRTENTVPAQIIQPKVETEPASVQSSSDITPFSLQNVTATSSSQPLPVTEPVQQSHLVPQNASLTQDTHQYANDYHFLQQYYADPQHYIPQQFQQHHSAQQQQQYLAQQYQQYHSAQQQYLAQHYYAQQHLMFPSYLQHHGTQQQTPYFYGYHGSYPQTGTSSYDNSGSSAVDFSSGF